MAKCRDPNYVLKSAVGDLAPLGWKQQTPMASKFRICSTRVVQDLFFKASCSQPWLWWSAATSLGEKQGAVRARWAAAGGKFDDGAEAEEGVVHGDEDEHA